MSAIIAAFAEYFVKFVILAAVAVAGMLCGNKIRQNKLSKDDKSQKSKK